jgi:uncharacterized RDD family membrane protein YckC
MTGPVANPYAAPVADLEPEWSAPEYGYRLAGLGQRWIGAFLDQLLFLLSAVPAGLVLVQLHWGPVPTSAVGLVSVVPLAVVQFYLTSKHGQSVGKKVCKTRIVRFGGSPPGFVHGVVLRSWVIWVATAIPGVGGIIGLVDALMIFRSDRRCAHDHIAGTRVIQI